MRAYLCECVLTSLSVSFTVFAMSSSSSFVFFFFFFFFFVNVSFLQMFFSLSLQEKKIRRLQKAAIEMTHHAV
jgi:hypothetical protein